MTSLGAAAGENVPAALGAGANKETVRAGTLGLGRLIGTLGSHDEFLSKTLFRSPLAHLAGGLPRATKHRPPDETVGSVKWLFGKVDPQILKSSFRTIRKAGESSPEHCQG